MSILVLVSSTEASHAAAFLRLLEGASAVLGVREAVKVAPIGAFTREARGRVEIVCAAVVSANDATPQGDANAQARNLETAMKAMLSAAGQAECDVRVFAAAPSQVERVAVAPSGAVGLTRDNEAHHTG